jgi:anti-anti-sigma factor
MTALRLDWTTPSRIAVHGDLTFGSAGKLLDAITARLAEEPGLGELCLDCTSLEHCDSYGLSMLLMAHRRAVAAGVSLRLENRPRMLDRMLELTGTVEHLTSHAAADERSS